MTEAIQCEIILDPPQEVFDRCLEVLAEGFRHYEFFHKLQQRDASSLDNLYAHLRTRLIPAFKGDAQTWIARRGADGPIEGVAVVSPPGKGLHDLPSFQALLPDLFALYSPDHQQWLRTDYAAMWAGCKLQPEISRALKEDYELVLIATHPEAQRRGFGNALLDAIAKYAFENGTGVWLMTQSHERAKTYLKAGYTPIMASEITFPDGSKIPNLAFERRQPLASSVDHLIA